MFCGEDFIPLEAWITLDEFILVETVPEGAKKNDIVFEQIVREHEAFMGFENVPQIKELFSIITQEVNLIFLTLENILLLRELLVLLSNHAHRSPNVILILIGLSTCQMVNKGLLNNFTGLEFLAVKDLAGLSHHWEVFDKKWMSSNV